MGNIRWLEERFKIKNQKLLKSSVKLIFEEIENVLQRNFRYFMALCGVEIYGVKIFDVVAVRN